MHTTNNFLSRSFFEQPTIDVAKNLLGKILVCNNKRGIITETEAYIGFDDPACHAAKGRTKRNTPMFKMAGYSYVYMIYGMYYCLNIVTEIEHFPAAVLIRGVYYNGKNIDGPGKLCREFKIDKSLNDIDLINNNTLSFMNNNLVVDIENKTRVGIKHGTDKLWRFLIKQNCIESLEKRGMAVL